MVKNFKISRGLQAWELPAGTDDAELTPVLPLVAILLFSVSEERWEKEPQRCKRMVWAFTQWRTKPNENFLQSLIILLVDLTEVFFTWLVSLNFVLAGLLSVRRNFRWDGRRSLSGGGAVFRVQNSHFISPTPFPVAQPDVLSILCYKMLSN